MTDAYEKKSHWIRRFVRWLFGSPFEELPPEFGDPVPPELRVFEAEVEEIQHHSVGKVASPAIQEKPTQPARRDEWLERE